MRLFSRPRIDSTAVIPSAIVAEQRPGFVCAPISGRVLALDEVDDPVFSAGMMGQGLAIEVAQDDAGTVFAPISGEVTALVRTSHALLVRADDGTEVLVHLGVDTVSLRGRGFRAFVDKGDRVRAGQAILAFDPRFVADKGLSTAVIVTVSDTDNISGVERACGEEVVAGMPILRVDHTARTQ